MSFRKRNVGVSGTQRTVTPASSPDKDKIHFVGIRPSAIDGRPTTSTGTATLDGLLAGHGGLALGTSILIEESGTTDFAGALLRFFAAEGLVQGHHVHVVGFPEQWGRELPGVVGESDKSSTRKAEMSSEKMKIAWRYERLGHFGADSTARDRSSIASPPTGGTQDGPPPIFCHTFDLTKRLVHPPQAQLYFTAIDVHPSRSPFDAIVSKIAASIAASKLDVVHRILVPSLLSPALYPPHACLPQHVLTFQRDLRALLAAYSARLVIMQTLPLLLHPRSSGLTKWLELLNDGVLELAPFPHSADAEFQASRDPTTKEEPPQGMLMVHRLPIFHDRAIGVAPPDNDWTFTLSRRKFTIKPFNLPPIDGDIDAQQVTSSSGEVKPSKTDLEF